MKQTTNYQLSQWEADDRVLRTDFNSDNAKIDAAIAAAALGNCRMEYGSYVGTGAYNNSPGNTNGIQVSFTPKLVIIKGEHGETAIFLNASTQSSCILSSGSGYALTVIWQEDGVRWWVSDNRTVQTAALNTEGQHYYYVALS